MASILDLLNSNNPEGAKRLQELSQAFGGILPNTPSVYNNNQDQEDVLSPGQYKNITSSPALANPEQPQQPAADASVLSPAQYRNMMGVQAPEEFTGTRAPAVVPSKPPVQAMLDKMSSAGAPNIDVSDSIAKLLGRGNDDFAAAQESARNMRLVGMLGKAGDTIGSSIARVKPHEGAFDDVIKGANQPVEDLKSKADLRASGVKSAGAEEELKNTMAKQDPNSEISKTYREVLKNAAAQAGVKINIKDDLTAANAEKILPGIEGMANRRLSAESTKAYKETANQQRQDSLDQRVESQTNTRYERATKDFTNALEGAKRIDGFLSEIKSGKLIPSSNVAASLTNDIAMLLAGKSGTALSDREHVAINTIQTTMSKIASFATNKPTSAVPPEYLKQIEQEVGILKKKYGSALERKSHELEAGVKNPLAKQIIKDRYNTFTEEYGGVSKEASSEAGPHGAKVMQNGHEYVWNPKTGKYE